MWKGRKGQARGDKKSPPLENKKYTVLGASIELIDIPAQKAHLHLTSN